MIHLFLLGRTPSLALTELKTFFPDILEIAPGVAKTELPVAKDTISKLGGTVKIAEVVDKIAIAPKSTFGISVYGGPKYPHAQIEKLKKESQAARFIEPHDGSVLSSVVVEKNHVQEFVIVGDIIGKTVAVQPFEDWNKRDFGRPHADPKAGMLPPKVARMVVNCAGIGHGRTLLDPFCGMGTVLSEALEMGWSVVGSDLMPDVVTKAEANLKWTGKTGYHVFVSDATHVSEHLRPRSVDAIVTEPFMGNPDITEKNAKNRIKGLEKLFIGCLKDWRTVLVPRGVVVMALPKYTINGKSYFVKKVIDMCENLGYTTMAGPIEYSRPQAVVKRSFYIWHT